MFFLLSQSAIKSGSPVICHFHIFFFNISLLHLFPGSETGF